MRNTLINNSSKPFKLFLIGFRATGKTSCALLLSERLSWPFIDMDKEIEGEIGTTIQEFVSANGWGAFREIEKRLLKRLLQSSPPLIVSTGGGIVEHIDCIFPVPEDSVFIWLNAGEETIKKRLLKDADGAALRPSLTGKDTIQEVGDVLKKRAPLYKRLATFSINVDNLSVKEAVDIIIQRLNTKQ